jgi:hypothetical protein
MKRVLIIAAVAGALFLVAAGTAFADVLVNYVPPHVRRCMKVGVWYQSSGGPRWAVIRIFHHGSHRAFWIKRTTASASHWKFWSVCPGAGQYVVRYQTAEGYATFHTRVG